MVCTVSRNLPNELKPSLAHRPQIFLAILAHQRPHGALVSEASLFTPAHVGLTPLGSAGVPPVARDTALHQTLPLLKMPIFGYQYLRKLNLN